jgi:cytochrome c
MQILLSLPIAAVAVAFAVVPCNSAEVGDAAQGQLAFGKCAPCHAKDKTNGIGPGLSGVMGSHAGSVPGFHYSQAMKSSKIVWDRKSLDAYIMAPQKALPGTTMPFPGIPSQQERNDLIAYLETLK